MTLRNLLSFRLGTWGALLSYYFLQRAITNVLLVLSTTLFLSRAGVDRLPLMRMRTGRKCPTCSTG